MRRSNRDEALLAVLTAIADHLANVHEVAPGVAVGTDVSAIRAAISAFAQLTANPFNTSEPPPMTPRWETP